MHKDTSGLLKTQKNKHLEDVSCCEDSQRLGGLTSMTESVGATAGLGFDSMSLPLRGLLAGPGTSSRSGVKTLLPLLVLGDCSVELKLIGERKP